MKIKFLTAGLVGFLLCAGCENDAFDSPEMGVNGTLTATVDGGNGSRAGFDETGAFYWSKKDAIGVTSSAEELAGSFLPFDLVAGGGTGSGTFKGTILEGFGEYAIYPYYEDKHSVEGTTLTYNFPAEYTYDKVDADYFTAVQGEGNSFCPAMWGVIRNNAVQLKHLGGVFAVKFDKLPVGDKLQLQFKTNQRIHGNFTTELAEGCALKAVPATPQEEDDIVKINFSNANPNTSGVFYVPVPTGNYANVRVKVVDMSKTDNNVILNVLAGKYNVTRKYVKRLEFRDESIDVTLPTEVTKEAATETLKQKDNIAITDEITGVGTTVQIPQTAGTSTEPVCKSVQLQKVAANAKVSISDENKAGDAKKSVEEFTLSIPQNDAVDYTAAPMNAEIDMPNTTVTLAGNAGKATYGTVTASTAQNTLVVSKGVTVNKIIVKKGNVRVCKGAEVKKFEKDPALKMVLVYKEAGAVVPVLPESFKVVDIAVADFRRAMVKGENYKLSQDIDIIDAQVEVPVDIHSTIDLNGYKIIANNNNTTSTRIGGNITVKGTLTINDASNGQGQIVASVPYSAGGGTGVVRVEGENAKLILNGGHILARPEGQGHPKYGAGEYGVSLHYGGDFEMNGGKIEARFFALCGNGNDKTTNSIIKIKGGELTCLEDVCIYLPQAGTTTISGAAIITGGKNAVAINRGNLILNGGVLKSLGTAEDDPTEQGDGSAALLNAALNVAGTYGDCNVTINGGELIAEKQSLCIKNSTTGNKPAEGQRNIVINGGTFSDFSALKYFAQRLEKEAGEDVYYSEVADPNKIVVNLQNDITYDINDYEYWVGVINLNGHKLISNIVGKSSYCVPRNGSLIINNGSLEMTTGLPTRGVLRIQRNGYLKLDKVNFSTNGVALFPQGDASKVDVNSSKITAGAYALSTNASGVDFSRKPIKLNLYQTTFEANSSVLLNVPSEVQMTSCVVNGVMHGVVMRGGSAVIKDSEIHQKYEDTDAQAMADYFNSRNWGEGNTLNLGALVMGNKVEEKSTSYKYPTNVKLENTKVITEGTKAGLFPVVYAWANKEVEHGVTFTYDNVSQFINAGKFNGVSSLENLVYGNDGKNITVNGQPAAFAKPAVPGN